MDGVPEPPRGAALADVPARRRRAPQGLDGVEPRRRHHGRPGEQPVVRAAVLAALGAAVYLVVAPPSGDLPAQLFRADLFDRAGFTAYSTAWFAGHHTPAYSVLFPPLGALFGVRVLGALCVVAAAAGCARLAGRAGAWAVPALLAALVSGQVTFLLGVAIGVFAVDAAARDRTALAALLGVLTALASPVAALFAGLCAAALGAARLREGVRPPYELAVAVAVPTLALAAAFPTGGTFPFAVSSFAPAFVAGVAVALAAPRGSVLRAGGALYALLCLAALAVPSPVGGNAVRLGLLAAVPVAVHLLWPARRRVLALLAAALAYWVLAPAVRTVAQNAGDPSTHAAFFAPIVERFGGRPVRIEVPMLRSHGEAYFVARRVSIARGWERQLDRERNGLFYAGFGAARYARWLRANAVAYVALPRGVPFDGAGAAEARLVATAPPFLRELRGAPGWRVFAVRNPAPIADNATVTSINPASVSLRPRGGRAVVRIHHSRWLACAAGRAGPWTVVARACP